jgi:DNA replication protein DnaC
MVAPNTVPRGHHRPNPDCPFTLTEVLDEPVPPARTDALIGDSEPTGRQCPGCGSLNQWWVMNPFVKASKAHGGWVLYEPRICQCPGSDPHEGLERRLTKSEPIPYDQAWLNAQFHQRQALKQTFLTFNPHANPKARLLFTEAQAFAQRLSDTLPETGLLLAGPAGIGKGHLLSAVAAAARFHGHAAVTLSAPQLLEATQPSSDDAPDERRDKKERWATLKALPLLCVRDLLLMPLAPSAIAALDRLLEARFERGRLTCVSAPDNLYRLKSRFGGGREETAALCRRVGRLTRLVAAPPGTPSYTHPLED